MSKKTGNNVSPETIENDAHALLGELEQALGDAGQALPPAPAEEPVKKVLGKNISSDKLRQFVIDMFSLVGSKPELHAAYLAMVNGLSDAPELQKAQLAAAKTAMDEAEANANAIFSPNGPKFGSTREKMEEVARLSAILGHAEVEYNTIAQMLPSDLAKVSTEAFAKVLEITIDDQALETWGVLKTGDTQSRSGSGRGRKPSGANIFESSPHVAHSFWRHDLELTLVSAFGLPSEWVEQNNVRGNWVVAFNRDGLFVGKTAFDAGASASQVLESISRVMGIEKSYEKGGKPVSEASYMGFNQSDLGSMTPPAKKVFLSMSELWAKLGHEYDVEKSHIAMLSPQELSISEDDAMPGNDAPKAEEIQQPEQQQTTA